MTEMLDLDGALQRWADAIEQAAPTEAPERTAECLSFNEAAAILRARTLAERHAAAQLLEARQPHIAGCTRCSRAVAVALAALQADLEAAERTERNRRAADYLIEHTTERREAAPIWFDGEGTLRLALDGLAGRRVHVSLQVGEDSIDLGEADVIDGRLQMERPLPELGVRERSGARELLAVRVV